MATQRPAKRTWIIEEARDPETGQELGGYDRGQASELLADLEAVLFTVGGVLHVATDRVQTGNVGSEPVYESKRLIFQWQAFAPGRAPDPEPEPVGVGAEDDEA
jgi:hypothetical protein